jgi:hypothetical protein
MPTAPFRRGTEALVVFIPDTKMVVATAANDGDITRAESAAWALVNASVKQSAINSECVADPPCLQKSGE